jgi:hypothetical protein
MNYKSAEKNKINRNEGTVEKDKISDNIFFYYS